MNSFWNKANTRILTITTLLLLAVLVPGAILLSQAVSNTIYSSYQANLRAELITMERALEFAFQSNDFQSAQKAVANMILAEHDTTAIDERVRNFSLGIYFGTGCLLLLLTGIVGASLHRLVTRPLQLMTQGEAPAGLADRPDEIGILYHRLKDLDSQAKEKSSQLDAQRRNFHALLTLTESIDVTLTAESVLQFAISKVQEVTGIATVAMRLFDSDQNCFILVAQSGMSPHMVNDLRCIPAEIGFTGDVYRTHRAAYTSDLKVDPRLESPAPLESGYHSLVSVPYLSGDRLMGSMELALKFEHTWSEDEIRWLELMGRSIGNVLHHIETSSQLQGLAIIQERTRIAQEIHDGLAQLIGTLRLWAEEAQKALRQSDLQEVKDDLDKIEFTARDAYASLREEILGLRDTISPGQGILPVIREFLSRYQRQWGIQAQLLAHQEQQPADVGQALISPSAEIQLLRIIQEALTNVRRHSQASQIVVSVEDTRENLHVEIRDNGLGFNPNQIPEDKFGLRIMRERAASVKGKVSIQSADGQGTHLIIDLPKTIQPVPVVPWMAGQEKD